MATFIQWYKRTFLAHGSVSDHLNCTWTALIFLVMGIVMYWLQIYISPISCWTPAEFKEAMVSFTNKHCWYAYKIYPGNYDSSQRQEAFSLDLPHVTELNLEEEKTNTIYQYLPLIIIFQSFFFKLPDIIWKCGINTIGISPSKLFGVGDGYENLPKAERKLVGKQMARYLYHYVLSSTMNGCPWGLITLLRIFVKSLYFINVVTQFVQMQKHFLDYKTLNWMVYQNMNTTHRNDTPIFPKSVLCEFAIQKLGNIHRYAAQCELPVNIWYELFCGVLTVWLLVILVITTISCFVDAVKFTIPLFRKRFMESYLSMIDDTTLMPQETGISYFSSFLGQDIVIILKLVAQSSGELLVGDTVIALWEIHSGHESGSHGPQPTPPPNVVLSLGDQPVPRYPQLKTDEVPLVPVASGSNIYPTPRLY